MTIYNLANYVTTGTGIDLIVNGWSTQQLGADGSMISQSGSNVAHQHKRKELRFQVLSRNDDRMQALTDNQAIFDYLYNRFSIELPAVTYGVDTFPEVQVAQISPMAEPQYIGTDDNGKHTFSVNFIVITE